MKVDVRSVAVCGAIAGVFGGGILLWRWWKQRRGSTCDNPYEYQKVVNEYMAFHYAAPSEYVAFSFVPRDTLDFPFRCAELCKRHKNTAIMSRALDVGCAVGRSTFELSTAFDQVIGIDFSEAFIDKANELAKEGCSPYRLATEGDLEVYMEARIESNIDRSKVKFIVGDACQLPNDIGKFGLVLAANLICRLPRPRHFLDRLKDLVVPAGIVVITSPYTWLEQYTPKNYWIAGFIKDNNVVNGFDALKEILSPDFILLEEENFPFVIRETLRKHQWTVAHATVWMRKIQT